MARERSGAAESPALVSIADIRRAARRIRPVAVRTPLLAASVRGASDREALAGVHLKAEGLQRTGSFKLRGAYNAIAALAPAVRARGVIAYSSGNHAGAVAYAARRLGVPAVVFMPEHAAAVKMAAVRENGAEVVIVGRSSNERRDRALALAQESGMAIIPNADHPEVIAGQGTVGLEIASQFAARRVPAVRSRLTVLVPVGGGGLASGVAVAITSLVQGARVIGVEPRLAGDAAQSLREGRIVEWPAADVDRTIADGLRLTCLGPGTFAHLHALLDDIVLVEESAIREAVAWAAANARLIVEPSGAVTLAAVLSNAGGLDPTGTTVCVLSGSNIDPPMLQEFLAGESVDASAAPGA